MFGLVTDVSLYNCFMVGIYNYRNRELLDMRRVPFYLKLGITTLISFELCRQLWINNLYDADVYRMALAYRQYYDKDWDKDNL